MADFKKTTVKYFEKINKVTPDTQYWRKFGVPVLLKEFGPINYIDFSPLEPYCFAASCASRVQIYNPITKSVEKTIFHFKENAFGATFRSDGRLLCAGGEEPIVKLFNVSSKSLLRKYTGHTSGIRRCFFTSDQLHIASFSDDKTVKVWDLATEKLLNDFSSHEDYVRAGAISPVSPTTLVSGCYDKKLRMFDTRTNTEAVLTIDHGQPVESVLFLPSGGIFISAGGSEVKVWDALAGGRLLARICQHHKTITCLCLASNGSRLMSGSLDRHVKIYDVSTYKVVHNIDCSNSILSIGISENDNTFAVGLSDGIISVSRMEKDKQNLESKSKKTWKGSNAYVGDKTSLSLLNTWDFTYTRKKGSLDHLLRKFEYGKCLEHILNTQMTNLTPEVTVAYMQELMRRKGLIKAIAVVEEKEILAMIQFITKHIRDQRFTRTLIDIFNVLLDYFQARLQTISLAVYQKLSHLLVKINEEGALTIEMVKIGGLIKMFFAASLAIDEPPSLATTLPSSQTAQSVP